MEEPIAIVGIGCRFPESENVNEFWKLLEEGRDTTSDVPPDRFSLKYYGSNHKSKGKTVYFLHLFYRRQQREVHL